jgi:hypothetical protein
VEFNLFRIAFPAPPPPKKKEFKKNWADWQINNNNPS